MSGTFFRVEEGHWHSGAIAEDDPIRSGAVVVGGQPSGGLPRNVTADLGAVKSSGILDAHRAGGFMRTSRFTEEQIPGS